jgi:hypothetical protein
VAAGTEMPFLGITNLMNHFSKYVVGIVSAETYRYQEEAAIFAS